LSFKRTSKLTENFLLSTNSHPNLFEAIQTKATTIETISPYRDDPAQRQSNPYVVEDEEDGRDNAELLQSQRQQMANQDNQLDHLSASIGRQHHLSLQMNEELETHATLLDEMDRDVENTGARLGRASRRLDQFTNSLKEHGESLTRI
jgi:syntaxin 8